ncbi:MAG: hypothetical protein NTW28_21910, partial [Candidatus Solibacter sp.]|nr:hypothetical protein [Candidatus Solibacter sp.]
WLNPVGRLYMLRQWSPLFGDAVAAVTAAQTLSSAGVPFQLLQEASIRPSVLRSRNVLLIGAPSYSTYAARVLRNTPFTIQNDTSTSDEVISGAPAEGQPSKPAFLPKHDERGRTSVVYGLITVVPSGPRPESEAQTVIISGMGGAGAQAAMEFFSSVASLRLLQRQFRKDNLTRVPPAYQVVVRCTMDQSLLMNWDLAAFKTIDPSRLLD